MKIKSLREESVEVRLRGELRKGKERRKGKLSKKKTWEEKGRWKKEIKENVWKRREGNGKKRS